MQCSHDDISVNGRSLAVRWLALLLSACLGLSWLSSCAPTSASSQAPTFLVSADSVGVVVGDSTPVPVSLVLANPGLEAVEVILQAAAEWISFDDERLVRIEAGATATVQLELKCLGSDRLQHSWLLIGDGQAERALPVRLSCPASNAFVATGGSEYASAAGELAPLALEPPLLSDALVVRIDPNRGPFHLRFEPNRDHLVMMPDAPVRSGMILSGGRNIVIVGGEIDIPWQGANPTISDRRAMYAKGQTGTLHLEGLKLHGEDISEGIQLNTPAADVQISNVAVLGLRARDQVGFTDNHPDLIQSYGGARSITVDRFLGSTDYQGLFFQAEIDDGKHGPVTLRRINIIGQPTSRYLLWFSLAGHDETVLLDEVWLEVPAGRSGGLGRAVWPDKNGTYPHRVEQFMLGELPAVKWPEDLSPGIAGYAVQGTPPDGYFVDAQYVGASYVSPGYVLDSP